jgi:hypothetical protein
MALSDQKRLRLRAARIACAVLLAAACSPYEPPVVEASALGDTLDTQGPYQVAATVKARRGVKLVELVWHNAAVGTGQAIHVVMVDDGSGVFRGLIPGSGQGAVIAYHVEAEDDSGDRGYWPEAAASGGRCGQEQCFKVLPVP